MSREGGMRGRGDQDGERRQKMGDQCVLQLPAIAYLGDLGGLAGQEIL